MICSNHSATSSVLVDRESVLVDRESADGESASSESILS